MPRLILNNTTARVLLFMQKEQRPVSWREIARGLSMHDGTCSRSLKALKEYSLVAGEKMKDTRGRAVIHYTPVEDCFKQYVAAQAKLSC